MLTHPRSSYPSSENLWVCNCLVKFSAESHGEPSKIVIPAGKSVAEAELSTQSQTVTTVYASEVMPANLRGYLTSYVNLCWVNSLHDEFYLSQLT